MIRLAFEEIAAAASLALFIGMILVWCAVIA
jgi:hypothetical protein